MTGSKPKKALRRWPAALLVLLAAALVPAAGAGASGGLDRSFGENGVVDLSYEPSRGVYSVADAVGTAPDGGIYVLGATPPCAGCESVRHLIRLRPNGARDMSYGDDGTVELPSERYSSYRLLVDERGRELVAYIDERGIVLMRLLPDGRFDAGFGSDGFVRFDCACSGSGLELRVNPPGRLQVAVTTVEGGAYTASGQRPSRAVVVTRSLREGGGLDTGFGVGGVATYRIANAFSPSAAIRLRGGGLAVAGGVRGGAGIYVGRIGLEGRLDQRFTRKARRALSARLRRRSPDLAAGGLMPRGGGRLDVFGQVGFEGFVARLNRDGSLDRRFGSGGIRLLPWTVWGALAGPGGRTFVFGEAKAGPMTVAWLGRDGRPLRSFSGGRGVGIEDLFVYEAHVSMQRGWRPLMLFPGFELCRGYCPPRPELYRFTRWVR